MVLSIERQCGRAGHWLLFDWRECTTVPLRLMMCLVLNNFLSLWNWNIKKLKARSFQLAIALCGIVVCYEILPHIIIRIYILFTLWLFDEERMNKGVWASRSEIKVNRFYHQMRTVSPLFFRLFDVPIHATEYWLSGQVWLFTWTWYSIKLNTCW